MHAPGLTRASLCSWVIVLAPHVTATVHGPSIPPSPTARTASSPYSALVARYCESGFDSVAQELGSWSERQVNDARAAAMALPPMLRALAAVMHTEVLASQWRTESGRVVFQHGDLARSLASHSRGPADGRARSIVRLWALAWGDLLLSHLFLRQAEEHFLLARQWFPRDADMLVGAGAVFEMHTTPLGQQMTRGVLDSSVWSRPASTAHAAKAMALYNEALRIDPGHGEAYLRLGRMTLASGAWREAGPALERVMAVSSDRRLLYLANLFLGHLHERTGDDVGAEKRYEHSVALIPSVQSARLALTALRTRLGYGSAALADLASYYDRTEPRLWDPWSDYLFVRSMRLAELGGTARRLACD